MIASEVIKQLKELIKIHGDLEVKVFEPEELFNGGMIEVDCVISIHQDEYENTKCFTIVDKETALGFEE
jgi:hypothetical protein